MQKVENRILVYIFMSLSCLNVLANHFDVSDEFSKVVYLQLPIDEDSCDIKIYNEDFTCYSSFSKDTSSMETICDSMKNRIISYYPDWELMVCFYKEFNEKYCCILIGNQWKLIDKKIIYSVYDTDSFLKKLSYVPDQSDYFYSDDFKRRNRVPSCEYRILKRKGDWIYIKSSRDQGWVRWKYKYKVFSNRLLYDL